MKSRSLISSFVILAVLTTAVSAGTYSGGNGTAEEPYRISTAADMNEIGADTNDWNAYFVLVNDINLADYTGTQFNIIGNSATKFAGVFDGNDHTISNFTYTTTDDYVGLFGYVDDANAVIKDLTLVDPNVTADECRRVGCLIGLLETGTVTSCNIEGCSVTGGGNTGGLVGNNRGTISDCYAHADVMGDYDTGGLVGSNSGTISNCYSSAAVTGIGGTTGGLVGENYFGTISNCYAAGGVTGAYGSGGLVGLNVGGTISDCYAHSDVMGDSYTGGVVGDNRGTISNCYAAGSVEGATRVGGLVGDNYHGTISNCYRTGNVTGEGSNIGGLIGYNNDGTISNCYADANVSGYDDTGGLVGGNRGTISNCYAAGSVEGTTRVGGLVGNNNNATISNCYATGSVTGSDYTGGLVGDNYNGTVSDSFWDIDTSGQSDSDGGEGKTTTEMMVMSTFLGWGCTPPIWTIDEGNDYPRLAWEEKVGEPITPTLSDLLDGAGTQEQPYRIYTAEQLNSIGMFSCEWDKHFVLAGNIDLADYIGTEFNIIGRSGAMLFTGVFDGNGHTISNFTYTTADDCIGIFGCVSGEVKNLSLVTPDVNAAGESDYVGCLVGRLGSGTVTGCGIEGGRVTGYRYTGGLIGYNNDGTISNCYAAASVSGVGYYTGSLVGDNRGTISNCYATGSVSGSSYTGGLVGDNDGTVNASFWDIETTGQSDSAGGEGKTTAEMKRASTFAYAGWVVCGDQYIWTFNNGIDYPRLSWQNLPGTPLLSDLLGGTGSKEQPYLICTAEELNLIGVSFCELDKHFQLANDIDLSAISDIEFNIIGGPSFPFASVFDGNGHTISNFTYNVADTDYIGLFGYVDDVNAVIKDLTLATPDVNAAGECWYVGCLVGRLQSGTITGCAIEAGSVAGYDSTGGLVGFNYEGTISNCYAAASVSGAGYYTGGLVGANTSLISNCYAVGSITGMDATGGLVGASTNSISNCYAHADVMGDYDIGGLVGLNFSTISDCYATGTALGGNCTGGLVGYNFGTISNCYGTGSVTGDGNIGGLVGFNYKGTVSNCYAAGSASGYDFTGGLVGYDKIGSYASSFWDHTVNPSLTGIGNISDPPEVIGESTTNMQTESTFTDTGWDFVDIWDICEGTNYPKLVWQIPIGDLLCPDGVNFIDYSFFAGHWRDDNCAGSNDCDGSDLDQSGAVDINDLKILADHWLEGVG